MPPRWVVAMWMRGETYERIKVPAIKGSSTLQQSSYEVLVDRATFSWGFGGRVFHLEFILPPVPMPSNQVEHIYAGLFYHHFNNEVSDI